MAKLLRAKDKIFFALAFLGDMFEEMHDPGGLVSASYKQVYGFAPKRYKKTNFANLVSRNLKTGNIEKVIKNGEIYLRLTSQGAKRVFRDFPLMSITKKPWDGKWRIVVFDIPQKQAAVRDRLRGKLKELGFGMLQKSTWVSPHDFVQDIREFLAFHNLEEMVLVLEAKNIAGFSNKGIVEKVFSLSKLNEEYKELLEECKNIFKKGKKDDLPKLKDKWLELTLKDPFFPKELLPKPWFRENIGKILKSKN